MINQTEELAHYRVLLVKSFIILFGLTAFFYGLAFYVQFVLAYQILLGALLGEVFSFFNVLALAYAFYKIVLKKSSAQVLIWPMLTFILSALSIFFVIKSGELVLLGLALGLTSPLIFAALIIKGLAHPA
jgi:hypothetical protein